MEKEVITLTCEVNKPNVKAKWLKNGEPISESEYVKMTSKDTEHTLTIPSAELDDEAVYKCIVGDRKTSARVSVKGQYAN